MAINDIQSLPCPGKQRSGILLDLPNQTFAMIAPCDCYDDVVVPIGGLVKLGNQFRQAVLQNFPKVFRFFRSGKLKEAIQINEAALNVYKSQRAGYVTKLQLAIQNRQLKAQFMHITLSNLKFCIASTPPGQVALCGGEEILHNAAVQAFKLAEKTEDAWLARIAEIDPKISARTINIQDLTFDLSGANDSSSWAAAVDARLTQIFPDYAADLLTEVGNFIGWVAFVEKHQCSNEWESDLPSGTYGAHLNPNTCRCTECNNPSLDLCEAWKNDPGQSIWGNLEENKTGLPQAPGIAVQDEENVCLECCGGTVSTIKSSIFWWAGGDSYCECECPIGLIKRPCKKEPEGKGCNYTLIPAPDCIDTCNDGVCAAPVVPSGKEWSDIECDFVCAPSTQAECTNGLVFSPYSCQCESAVDVVTDAIILNNSTVALTVKTIVPGGGETFYEIQPRIVSSNPSRCCASATIDNNTVINTYLNYGLIETKTINETINPESCPSS